MAFARRVALPDELIVVLQPLLSSIAELTSTIRHYDRVLVVQCDHYILGTFGADTDLRRLGLRLAERGGNNAKKVTTPRPGSCFATAMACESSLCQRSELSIIATPASRPDREPNTRHRYFRILFYFPKNKCHMLHMDHFSVITGKKFLRGYVAEIIVHGT